MQNNQWPFIEMFFFKHRTIIIIPVSGPNECGKRVRDLVVNRLKMNCDPNSFSDFILIKF